MSAVGVRPIPVTGRILVASDDRGTGAIVRDVLQKEFEDVALSIDGDDAFLDWDDAPPAVLVLAFQSTQDAQRHYLRVSRFSRTIHLKAHWTLLLCKKDEVRAAYDLCRKQIFDDYLLFWPAAQDGLRLPMAVLIGLREVNLLQTRDPGFAAFVRELDQLRGLEALLKARLAQVRDQLASAGSVEGTAPERKVPERAAPEKAAPERAAQARGNPPLPKRGLRLVHDASRVAEIEAGRDRIASLTKWAAAFGHDLEPHLDSLRTLQGLAERAHKTILVVDDDAFQRRMVRSMLATSFYELAFASSGAEALAVVESLRPDLILMDVVMPEMSGTETARRLRLLPHGRSVPIIMMTGQSRKPVVAESIEARASGFVVKPLKRETLLAKIAEALKVSDAGDFG